MNNEESLSSMSKIGIAESPETNRHNKRNSNGRISKLRKGGHKEKSLHLLRKGLAARRSLVFDECDENEPSSKRQTRSEKVQYKVVHLFIFLHCKLAIQYVKIHFNLLIFRILLLKKKMCMEAEL